MLTMLLRLVLLLVLLLASVTASACPEGYYESCFIKCWCTPNSGKVSEGGGAALNPLPDTLNTAAGIVQGDVGKISQGVGGLVIKSSCKECAALGQMLLDKPDKEFVERVVGRGWLLYVAGVDPTYIIADAATSVVTQYVLHDDPPPIPVPPPPANRGKKTYSTSVAQCIVGGDNGAIVVGWPDAPQMRDQKSGVTSIYPNVDLIKDDVITVASDDSCPNVPQGQVKYKFVRISFTRAQTVASGVPANMHYFFHGQLLPEIAGNPNVKAKILSNSPSLQKLLQKNAP